MSLRQKLSLFSLAALAAAAPAWAGFFEGPWPQTWDENGLTFMLYQPQAQRWEGDVLAARAAVAVKEGDEGTRYGVLELTARAERDEGAKVVHLRDVRMVKVAFPAAPGGARAWRGSFERHLPAAYDAPLDDMEEALAMAQAEKPQRRALRNAPPAFVFRTSPAILVYVDGEPQLRPVEGTPLQRVVNTRPLLLQDPRTGRYDLRLLDGWVEAAKVEGPWAVAEPRPELAAALAWASKRTDVDLLEVKAAPEEAQASGERVPPPSLSSGKAPDIVVATRPTELVVTDGAPQLEPIPGTDLLYWKNTSSDVLVDSAAGDTYLLAAGRWFRAQGTNGPWTYVAPKQLPGDFARIPPDHPKATVLASVPGTPQAKEALLANAVPQTATVQRSEAKFTPTYDEGAPRLEPIEGTRLSYVRNAPVPIIEVTPTSWYAVRDGVWFTAASAYGPWAVAASVPAVLYTIPPASPIHYVTYVRVYGATPEVVYVGYTPGYLGTYVAPGGVVVYGSGYVYRPWVGTVWYGPPVTYGFVRVGWSPWWGWGVAPCWAWRPAGFWWGFGVAPHWGPMVVYRPVYYAHRPVYFARAGYRYHGYVPAPPAPAVRAGAYGAWSGHGVRPAPHPAPVATASAALARPAPPAPRSAAMATARPNRATAPGAARPNRAAAPDTARPNRAASAAHPNRAAASGRADGQRKPARAEKPTRKPGAHGGRGRHRD